MAGLVIKNLPDELHRKLKARAAEHRRSMTQEVLQLLERGLADDETVAEPPAPYKGKFPLADELIDGLSIDEKLLERVRVVARDRGRSVNQLLREYLEQLVEAENLESVLKDFRETSGQGHRRHWRFDRDELHERT